MDSYSVRDVERVLQLSRSTIQGLIDGGFVKPARGPRRQYRFSFRDLIVLRTARALTQAKVSHRRIRRSLADLRRNLPETAPLSGISISAVGDRVVVREGKNRWQVDDGQMLLGLDVSVDSGELHVVEHPGPAPQAKPAPRTDDADVLFATAIELEESDPDKAGRIYERVTGIEPANIAAWTNWGRLLHEQGLLHKAENVYRRALNHVEPDPVLLFNLGVVLEDQGRTRAALEAYQSAITEDPGLADGHYNLARLYETLGQPQHAIRHLGQYRRLVSSDSR